MHKREGKAPDHGKPTSKCRNRTGAEPAAGHSFGQETATGTKASGASGRGRVRAAARVPRTLPSYEEERQAAAGKRADPPDDVARGAVTCNRPPARVQCQDSHFYEVPTNAQPGAHREDTVNKPTLRHRLPHDGPSSSKGPREQHGKADDTPDRRAPRGSPDRAPWPRRTLPGQPAKLPRGLSGGGHVGVLCTALARLLSSK